VQTEQFWLIFTDINPQTHLVNSGNDHTIGQCITDSYDLISSGMGYQTPNSITGRYYASDFIPK
jgi:hypothetical protein